MVNSQWGEIVLYSIPVLGLLGILIMAIKSAWVTKQDAGDENMQELAGYIARGAMAFLKAEWKILSYFVIIAGALLAYSGTIEGANSSPIIAVAFVIGAVFSAFAGYIGMNIATKANVRTTQAARTSLAQALKVSFTGGSVMGLGVAGLAVLGLGSLFIVFYMMFVTDGNVNGDQMAKALEVLAGFSLGAESIALFARVGGGIYTKAADVGADLVGKVEAGIPEDDVRNPATIADNVGDNVGDVAGMGADLFGSYVATILATMVLGREIKSVDNFGGIAPILLPMLIAGLGIVFSIIGMLFVRVKDENGNVQGALNLGNWSSIILTGIASFFIVGWMLPEKMEIRGEEFTRMDVFYAIVVGLVVGALMSIITEYYTAMGKRPVLSIIKQSATGHATNIIGGLSVGMESTVLPILVLAAGIYGSYAFAGLYGVAIAAAGMMATTAMQLAIDAFGPIADNAGGIAEMSQLPEEVRHRTDNLDAVGNTTAATGKGFAIASAALTSLALFAAFVGIAGIDAIDIYKADVLAGLFVGGMIPFIFSSLAIAAVGRAAMDMVNEVRRQFREIPGIMEYKAKPEYEKCVAISTNASIREMIAPGAIALIVPIVVGFLFGPEVLGGLLAGVTVSGVLMGMFQSNAGGAWDNAKKSFEKGVEINGEMFYKKSEPHKASVTGDTVGDPFKDTSGPSMNILIKLMSIVALIIAPHISEKGHGNNAGVAPIKLENANDSLSYSIGLMIGNNFVDMQLDSAINHKKFVAGMEHATAATPEELQEANRFIDLFMKKKEAEKMKPLMQKEQDFLNNNKNQAGVVTTNSGLQYQIISEGSGINASATDSVSIHYKGTLISGEVFDSSEGFGTATAKPVGFMLNKVIPGFTEGLQLIKEGGKIKLFIPSALAYGDMAQGSIPAFSTLVFEIELVKVTKK
jgi:K(+)-stimulated pyrophosphate-energized sodium pump